MQDKYKYYIGCTDYFGKNQIPDEVFNNVMVPYLEKHGLKEKDIKEVAKMVCEIAEAAWSNSLDNAQTED